jgi:hypothetical protein
LLDPVLVFRSVAWAVSACQEDRLAFAVSSEHESYLHGLATDLHRNLSLNNHQTFYDLEE